MEKLRSAPYFTCWQVIGEPSAHFRPSLEPERPDRVVLARPAEVGGQVGDELAAGGARLGLEGGQRPRDQPADVGLERGG